MQEIKKVGNQKKKEFQKSRKSEKSGKSEMWRKKSRRSIKV